MMKDDWVVLLNGKRSSDVEGFDLISQSSLDLLSCNNSDDNSDNSDNSDHIGEELANSILGSLLAPRQGYSVSIKSKTNIIDCVCILITLNIYYAIKQSTRKFENIY
jgi:hypothetical protein